MDTNRITASLLGLGLVIFGLAHSTLVSFIGLAILLFMSNPTLGRSGRTPSTPDVSDEADPVG